MSKLREHIDYLFRDAPPTKKTVEIKEEFLQNITEKYEDLIAQGKTEEAAYNIVTASIGEIGDLLNELKGTAMLTEEEKVQEQQYKQRKAIFTSVSIALYIISVIPLLIIGGGTGAALTLLLIAAATGMLIYNNMTMPSYLKNNDSMAQEFQAWRESSSNKQAVFKSVSSALWALTVVVYILISFTYGHWGITWVIFLIAAAVNSILKAIFDLKK